MSTKIQRILAPLFEEKPDYFVLPTEYDWEYCLELVLNKLDYLTGEGLLTYGQVDLLKEYLPYAEVEDLLLFQLGYKGFISEALK